MVKARRAAQAYKAYQDISRPGSPGLGARIRALPRMLAGALRGDYRELGKGKLALMGAAILYIVSPVDVVPEALFLALGVVDDFGVFLWLATSLLGESGRYVDWERRNLALSPEPGIDRHRRA